MISPIQSRAIREHYERDEHLYFTAERYDVDYEQLQEIVDELDLHLPGKGFNFNAILAGDPIASDSLVIQCQQTINRLDDLYFRALKSFNDSKASEHTKTKKTSVNTSTSGAKAGFYEGASYNPTIPDSGSERTETTTQQNPNSTRWFEVCLKTLDRSMKTQITLTKRREKLQERLNSATSPTASPAACSSSLARRASEGSPGQHPNGGKIANQLHPSPYTQYRAYQGYSENGYRDLNAYEEVSNSDETVESSSPLAPRGETAQKEPPLSKRPALDRSASEETGRSNSPPPPSTNDPSVKFPPPRRFTPKDGLEEFHAERKSPHKFVNDLLAEKQSNSASRGRQSPESIQINTISTDTTNIVSQRETDSREEEPVTQFQFSAPPRETSPPPVQPTLHSRHPDPPPHHKRE